MVEDKKYIYSMCLGTDDQGKVGVKFPSELPENIYSQPLYLLPAKPGEQVTTSEYTFPAVKGVGTTEFTLVYDPETGDMKVKETEIPESIKFKINYSRIFDNQPHPVLPYIGKKREVLGEYNEFLVLTADIPLLDALAERNIFFIGKTSEFPEG